MSRRSVTALSVLVVVGVVVYVYYRFNPAVNAVFPRCPVNLLFHVQCPGCGSQRAIHCLLHGDLSGAWRMNPLLVVSVPYLLVGGVINIFDRNRCSRFLRDKLYGKTAAIVWLVIVVLFTVFRNIWQ